MITVTCELCGAQIVSVSSQRRFCPKCQKERDRVKSRLRYQRKKMKVEAGVKATSGEVTNYHSLADKFEKKQKGPSIAEVSRAAAKAGMTYGKYVEKYGDKWR